MKTSIKILSALLVSMLTFFACEKGEVKKEEKIDKYAVDIKVLDLKGSTKNGVLVGEKEELLKSLDSEKGIIVKKQSLTNELFIPTIPPVTPTDTWVLCESEIMAIYEQNLPEWRAEANRNCRDVIVCLTCPNANGGMFMLFVIKPTSAKCAPLANLEHRIALSKFDFNFNDYDSESVNSFINKER